MFENPRYRPFLWQRAPQPCNGNSWAPSKSRAPGPACFSIDGKTLESWPCKFHRPDIGGLNCALSWMKGQHRGAAV